MLSDLGFAWRVFTRNIGSFSLVIAILALSIGSTADVFTVMDVLLFRPLPIEDQNRIVHLGGLAFNLPSGDGVAWWSQAQALEVLATYSSGRVSIEGEGGKRWARGAVVSSGFFSVFGVRPSIGRDFSKSDVKSAQDHIVIVSRAFWLSYFGARQSVVGAEVRVNDIRYTVVGVGPETFEFPNATELWFPGTVVRGEPSLLAVDSGEGMSSAPMRGWVGKLREGSSVEQAKTELYFLLHRLQDLYTAKTRTRFGEVVSVVPLRELLARNFKPAAQLFFAGALFTLLVASANCAIFLLGRAIVRRKEIAVRQVFGATTGRILSQMMTETAAMGLVSGLLGFLVALASLIALRKLFPRFPANLPDISSLAPTIFVASLVASVFVALLAGLVPALLSASTDSLAALKDTLGPPSSGGRGLRKILVITEVAVALLLTVGAALSVKTFLNLTALESGLDPQHTFVVRLTFPQRQISKEQFVAQQQEILDGAKGLPNLSAIGASSVLPVASPSAGQWVRHSEAYKFCLYSLVAGDYFRATGIPFIAGRGFSDTDSTAVIISERTARDLFQGRSPIGEELRIDGEERPRQVVGVVKDTGSANLSDDSGLRIYLPFARPYRGQFPSYSMYLVFRCSHRCADTASLLMQELKGLGAWNAMDQFTSLGELIETAVRPVKLRTVLLSAYALLALALALVGVYALASHLSALRSYEMGVRMALGAQPLDIVLLIMGDGIVSAAIGVAVGEIASLALVKLLESLLLGVKPLDPPSFLIAGALLLAGAATASLIPAVRMARNSPRELLQTTN